MLKIKEIASKFGILIVLIALIIFFSVKSEAFFTTANIFNILRQVAIVGIIAVGMTFVMITGGIDLSVGSIVGVSGVLCATLMVSGWHPVPSVIAAITLSCLIGALNAFFINELSIPPLISTLGMMTGLRGVAFLIAKGLPVYGFTDKFTVIGQGYIWVIPIPVIIMTIIFILGYIFLSKTKYGRYIYGVGGNEEASRLSGVSVKKMKCLVYSICGGLSGLAGVILLSRVNSGLPKAGTSYEMDVITAVVLGGVSTTGGEGKIGFVVLGILLMGILANGMILIDISEYVQWVIKGAVLICAVGFDRVSRNKKNVVS